MLLAKENEVGSVLGSGEVQLRRKEISETMFEYLKIKAKGEQKFLYTWSRKNDLVLRSVVAARKRAAGG